LKPYSEHIIPTLRFNEENGFYTTRQKSEQMSRIKSRNTKPEMRLRKALWKSGLRYRKNVKSLPGCPDIVFNNSKLAVFVDGEFWHGYQWEEKKQKIKSNRNFWIPKIERNMQRDRINDSLLFDQGWYVMRFWESDIKKRLDDCVNKIINFINDLDQT
jgi:DNA mismatch endonuclease, patch repair protein